MNIQIPEFGIIKEQNFEIRQDVSIIYGYNNSGKTTILRVIYETLNTALMTSFLRGVNGQLSVYIPTNRVVCSPINTKAPLPRDVEEFITYQKDSYQNYSLHLKHIRDYLLNIGSVVDFICWRVNDIFGLQIEHLTERYSDGVENIINIYLCIIWMMVWDASIDMSSVESLREGLAQKESCILIDEIEMFLHVKVQAALIASLKNDFQSSYFLLTTHSPLMLTRYRDCSVYRIDDGILSFVEGELYYKDLDHIYEGLFFVDEIPPHVADELAYLGEVLMGECPCDEAKIDQIAAHWQEECPNLFQKYMKIISKAQNL